jgi:hypothetical protein
MNELDWGKTYNSTEQAIPINVSMEVDGNLWDKCLEEYHRMEDECLEDDEEGELE